MLYQLRMHGLADNLSRRYQTGCEWQMPPLLALVPEASLPDRTLSWWRMHSFAFSSARHKRQQHFHPFVASHMGTWRVVLQMLVSCYRPSHAEHDFRHCLPSFSSSRVVDMFAFAGHVRMHSWYSHAHGLWLHFSLCECHDLDMQPFYFRADSHVLVHSF